MGDGEEDGLDPVLLVIRPELLDLVHQLVREVTQSRRIAAAFSGSRETPSRLWTPEASLRPSRGSPGSGGWPRLPAHRGSWTRSLPRGGGHRGMHGTSRSCG